MVEKGEKLNLVSLVNINLCLSSDKIHRPFSRGSRDDNSE